MNEGLEPIMVHVFPAIRQGGGPAGYGFNLRSALLRSRSPGKELLKIVSPDEDERASHQGNSPSRKFRLLQRAPGCFSACLLLVLEQRARKHSLESLGFSSESVELIRRAKAVVFHDCRLLGSYLRQFGKSPGQQVLAMSHAASGLSAELVRSWRAYMRPSRAWERVHALLAADELRTYLLADGLIVPDRHSLDVFFSEHPKRSLLLKLPIYEVPSGVARPNQAQDRGTVLRSLGIPLGKKVVGFFGRHHPDKGYDHFCECARIAWDRGYEDLYFLSAGAGPLVSPDLPNFKDIGFISVALGDVIGAVDLVVSPSRVSYFELGILEAMALGRPVLMTRIGMGKSLKAPGVFAIDEVTGSSLLDTILELTKDTHQLARRGEENIPVYFREYGLDAFAQRHVGLAKRLVLPEE